MRGECEERARREKGEVEREVANTIEELLTIIRLCGFTPFYGDNQRQLFERILHAQFDFPAPEWDDITPAGNYYSPSLPFPSPSSPLPPLCSFSSSLSLSLSLFFPLFISSNFSL